MDKRLRKTEYFFVFIVFIVFVIVAGKYFDFRITDLHIWNAIASNLEELKLKKEFDTFYINVDDGNMSTSEYAETISVLVYHGLPNTAQSEPDVSKETFKNHLFALKKSGYETITLKELAAFLKGNSKLPPKSFLITFDDGIKTSYYNADPILKILNYNAVMFVVSGFSLDENSSYYLNGDEIKEMVSTGRWEIQSHGYTGHHRIEINNEGSTMPFYANKSWLEKYNRLETDEEFYQRILFDISKSRDQLGSFLSEEINAFAIPFNDFGQYETNYENASNILKGLWDQFFELVFFQFRPVAGYDFRSNYVDVDNNGAYLVMRISIDINTDTKSLVDQINASQSKKLPYYDSFLNKFNWILLWGELEQITGEGLKIKSPEGSNSVLIYLDGSYLWQNYIFKVVADKTSGRNLSLLARYNNSKEFVACEFENDDVSISVTLKGEKNKIATKKYAQNSLNNTALAIKVYGDIIHCEVDDLEVISAKSLIPEKGGVGLKFWDPEENNVDVFIKSTSIYSYDGILEENFDDSRELLKKQIIPPS